MPNPWFSIAAIFISTLALLIAVKNYWRKAGLLVRGSFGITSSRDCEDRYVSSVLIENLKDRAITIFAIYLRVGEGYYIEIEDFEESPLILKAYETFQKQYGPIQFYSVSSNKVNLNSLFENKKIRKRLVLSTSNGKYVVPASIKHWSPTGDFFRNYLTAHLRPIRLIHKAKHIGGNARYIIEFVPHEGKVEVVSIHPRDYELKMFNNFSLTRESLESADSLKNYLEKKIEEGLLKCKSYEVHDVNEWKLRNLKFYSEQTIKAVHYGFWRYNLMGRLGTWFSNRSMIKKNKDANLKRLHKQVQTSSKKSDT